MNLIHDPWLKAINKQGVISVIPFRELVNPQWIEVFSPRPDFKGAIYQFLIGLLQTCFAPADLDCWIEHEQSPPDANVLEVAFSRYQSAFELKNNNASAFMQDFSLEGGEECPIAGLLIESPGESTVKENRDLFVKRDRIEKICSVCAAMALFTLQINAPSGGQGHRVGLRGGGPLTTLVFPFDQAASLWQRLWFNVLPSKDKIFQNNTSCLGKDIFPWIAPTRTSERQGVVTCPEDVHPLQMYWAMPRRIRLNFSKLSVGYCDICGEKNNELLSSYFSKNYGINYAGNWEHPLTPYRHDLKGKNPPLSIKGQMGGIGYRHWLGLTLGNEKQQEFPAAVVNNYRRKMEEIGENRHYPLVWCFGYDMDNMKARCWYENKLPLFNLKSVSREILQDTVHELLTVAREALALLKKYLKSAWFSPEGQSKNLDFFFIERQFWEISEDDFYACIREIVDDIRSIVSIYEIWLNKISRLALFLFDTQTLTGLPEDRNMQRIIMARNDLEKWLKFSTPLRDLWKKIGLARTESVEKNKETV